MLTVDKVSKTFFPGTVNERKALSGVELTLGEGDFVTVIGSNGAGKSTLLNAVSGRLAVDSGRIEIAGSAVNKLGEHSRAPTSAACSRIRSPVPPRTSPSRRTCPSRFDAASAAVSGGASTRSAVRNSARNWAHWNWAWRIV